MDFSPVRRGDPATSSVPDPSSDAPFEKATAACRGPTFPLEMSPAFLRLEPCFTPLGSAARFCSPHA